MTESLPSSSDIADVALCRQKTHDSVRLWRKTKKWAPEALHHPVTESTDHGLNSIRCKGGPKQQRKQQQQQQQPKPRHTPKGTPTPQKKHFMTEEEVGQAINEVANLSIETEKAGSVGVLSTPEKVCQSSMAAPERECSSQRMQGVHWDTRHSCWLVCVRKRGEKNRKKIAFPRHKFMKPGRTEEEADEEARRQAFAFRQSLEQKGAIRPYGTSGMKYINWQSRGFWQAIWFEDGKCKKRAFAASRYEKLGMSSEEAKETAMWNAVAFRASVMRQKPAKRPKTETKE